MINANPYLALVIMLIIAIALALGGLGASAVFGPTKKNFTKYANYECGIDPIGHTVGEGRFPIKYYLVAMTFIIFDIEVVFLYPWAVSMVELGRNDPSIGLFSLGAILLFIGLITVPYVYEWRRGGLEWD